MTPPASKQLFIDETVTVHQGQDAAQRLAAHNDLRFFEPGKGIARVDRARWEEAQRYERRTWMELNRGAVEDRNQVHAARFAGYEALAGRAFPRAIELGCGPFTNLRHVLEVANVGEVHLLDPLAKSYLDHPGCRYRGGYLSAEPRFPGTRLRTGRARSVKLEPCSIEDYRPDGRFDLVVMVNVLEHCQDAEAVLARVDELLVPGGTFVFHDTFIVPDRLEEVMHALYDAGHPIRLDRRLVEGWLAPRFLPRWRAEVRASEQAGELELPLELVYFIGDRRA
jgi:SAM-dependent methyltransferase